MGDTDDLATLSCLDSATLLKELRARYARDKIYVSMQDRTGNGARIYVTGSSTDLRGRYIGVCEPIQATIYIRK